MLRRVALVRTDVSEELSSSFIRVRASVIPSSPILVTLMKEALSSSETSVLTRATRRNILDDAILHYKFLSFQDSLYTYVLKWVLFVERKAPRLLSPKYTGAEPTECRFCNGAMLVAATSAPERHDGCSVCYDSYAG
jgi:hypothetical protein